MNNIRTFLGHMACIKPTRFILLLGIPFLAIAMLAATAANAASSTQQIEEHMRAYTEKMIEWTANAKGATGLSRAEGLLLAAQYAANQRRFASNTITTGRYQFFTSALVERTRARAQAVSIGLTVQFLEQSTNGRFLERDAITFYQTQILFEERRDLWAAQPEIRYRAFWHGGNQWLQKDSGGQWNLPRSGNPFLVSDAKNAMDALLNRALMRQSTNPCLFGSPSGCQ